MDKDMDKNNFLPIAEGVLRGFILTLILLLIYAAIMSFTEISEKVSSIFYMITTLLSVMYAVIYAVRKLKRRGWLIGLIVSFLYMIILFLVSLVGGRSGTFFTQGTILRLLLALLIGALSGMLGVNV